MQVRDYQAADEYRLNLVLSGSLGGYDPRPARQSVDIHFLRGARHLRAAYDEGDRRLVVDGPRRDVLDHLRRQGFAFCGDRS